MPLSRMENTTFAMPSIIDSHDMGLRTVYSPDAQKKTPIQRLCEETEIKYPNSTKCARKLLLPFPSLFFAEYGFSAVND
ncbi:hypothetical protein TNCV_1138351 [Trichonephila clavipes]|nr:hypothetical protein TNCV_1138351 [Trichonephila clavipes]